MKKVKWMGIVILFLSAAGILMELVSPESKKIEPGISAEEVKSNDTDAGSENNEPSKAVYSVEGLSEWMERKITEGNSDITEEEVSLWGQAGEKTFQKVWKKALLKQIKGWEDREDYQKTAADVSNACSLYKQICGSGKTAEDLLQYAKTISSIVQENEELVKKYDFDIQSDRDKCLFGTFYIDHKLETAYSDNLTGKLQKEIDSYQTKDYLDWAAYEVEYILGEASPGSTCQMVIRTDADEAFEGRGAYDIAYLDTGETIDLQFDGGFQKTVPVCWKIGDAYETEEDIFRYTSNIEICFALCQEIEEELKTGRQAEDQEDADTADHNSVAGTGGNADNADSRDYIFADSSQRLLDDWELELCDSETLHLARNEIYARHGRRFKDEAIQAYFDSKSWYNGTINPEDFDDSVFNEYEIANLDKIKMHE